MALPMAYMLLFRVDASAIGAATRSRTQRRGEQGQRVGDEQDLSARDGALGEGAREGGGGRGFSLLMLVSTTIMAVALVGVPMVVVESVVYGRVVLPVRGWVGVGPSGGQGGGARGRGREVDGARGREGKARWGGGEKGK